MLSICVRHFAGCLALASLLFTLPGSVCAQEDDARAPATVPTSLAIGQPAWYDEVMEDPAEFDFEDTPLAEVIEHIGQRHEIPIQLDLRALDDAGVTAEVPLTCHIHNVPLADALDWLLREHELTWTVRDEMLLITTAQEVENDLIVRVYPVLDLVTPEGEAYLFGEGDYSGLGEVIVTTCSPNTWDEGNVYLPIHQVSGTLVIVQTLRVHRQIEELLEGLRVARRQHLSAAAGANEGEDLVLRVYRPRVPAGTADIDAWSKQLAALFEEMVEPASWQTAGGAGRIYAVGGMIFVRQTPEVQAQIDAISAKMPTGSHSVEAGGGSFWCPLAPVEE